MSFWKVVGLIGGACLAPFTGGTSLYVSMALCGGIGLVAGHLLDEDQEKKKQEKQKLALAGEAGKAVQSQVNNLQDQRSQEVSKANTLDQQVAQKQAKLNDPNVSEQEKTQIRSEITSLISQRSQFEQNIKNYDKQIENLLKNIPGLPGTSNSVMKELDTQKLLMIGGACLVVYLLVIKDKEK